MKRRKQRSGSRGGKGTSSIVNNLIVWPGSVCVVDPKGALRCDHTSIREVDALRAMIGVGLVLIAAKVVLRHYNIDWLSRRGRR